MIYLKEHLKKYPKMELDDIIKLYLQGTLGPAHLVLSADDCLARVTKEYESIKDIDLNDEMIEDISESYVRIYLKPYYEYRNSFQGLVKAFVLSSQIQGDKENYKSLIRTLKTKENEKEIEEYLNSNLLISHSQTYKDNYNPHYLVIHRNYLYLIF